MLPELLVGGAVAAILGYQVFSKRSGAGSRLSSEPELADKYASGSEEPSALAGEWATYHGARPELRGSPRNTILNVKGLASRSPEFRARLLDLAEDTGIPVDTLAVVMASESGFNPQAVYKKDGKPFAVGLFQLTRGANLPGFSTVDDLSRVLEMNAEEQLENVGRPYFSRMSSMKGATPGKGYMLNFLPEHAGKPDDWELGIRDERHPAGHPKAGELTWLGKVYDMNKGFDPGGKNGRVTVGSVKDASRSVARGAKGARITVDGKVNGVRAQKGIAAAVGTAVDGARSEAGMVKKNADGTYPLLMSVRGVLREDVLAGQFGEPFWKTIRIDEYELDVTSDAIMAGVGITITEEDLGKPFVRDLLRSVGIEKPTVVLRGARLPVSYDDTIAIAKRLGAVTPTKRIWDETFERADVKLPPQPIEAGPLMATMLYSLVYNEKLDRAGAGAPGTFARDVGKGWILSPRLKETGAVNYGWIDPVTRKPIQTPGAKHDPSHVDYSQTLVLVRREAKKNGSKVDLLDELAAGKLGGEGIERRFIDAFR